MLTAGMAYGNTIIFTTDPSNHTINPGTGPINEDARVTFITSLNQIILRVENLQIEESGSIAQTINTVEFKLNTPWSTPFEAAHSGAAINLASASGGAQLVNYTPIVGGYGNLLTNRWTIFTGSGQNTIAGGIQISTISGGNPNETIIGPPNQPGKYLANAGLRGDNPFLQTDTGSYIQWTITFAPGSGVTSSTNVTQATMAFGTALVANQTLNLITQSTPSPEPGTVLLMISGLALAVGIRRRTV